MQITAYQQPPKYAPFQELMCIGLFYLYFRFIWVLAEVRG